MTVGLMVNPASPIERAPRHVMAVPVRLKKGVGRCRNISNSGMYFEMDEPLAPGAVISVAVTLDNVHPMPPIELTAEGRVVRAERHDGKFCIAIAFTSTRYDTADTAAASKAVSGRRRRPRTA